MAICNGPHQCRLTAVVAAAQTISLPPFQPQLCLVQQDLVPVGQAELTVAQILVCRKFDLEQLAESKPDLPESNSPKLWCVQKLGRREELIRKNIELE